MSIELRPLGVKCNLQCQYCYQNPIRDAGNVPNDYDMDKMLASIESANMDFTLFGGEALLVPVPDLKRLFAYGFEKFGKSGIQTNGTLLTDEHIALFQKYNVSVGISADGPVELNDSRWGGTLEITRKRSAKTLDAIRRLCEAGSPPGVITTLQRLNATADKLPRMYEWMHDLDDWGVQMVRLHNLEVESGPVGDRFMLTPEENIAAFLGFAALESSLSRLRFDVFKDMRSLLMGQDRGLTCVWGACDPFTTRAVQGVEGNGQTSNCGRTSKDGVDFTKADSEGFERYYALYNTPVEHNGCGGCRFFAMCKGQCPGTAIDGDWRNRTSDCKMWFDLYSLFERELVESGKTPVSLSPAREAIERHMLDHWITGRNVSISDSLRGMMHDTRHTAVLSAHFEANGLSHTVERGRITHVDHADRIPIGVQPTLREETAHA